MQRQRWEILFLALYGTSAVLAGGAGEFLLDTDTYDSKSGYDYERLQMFGGSGNSSLAERQHSGIRSSLRKSAGLEVAQSPAS